MRQHDGLGMTAPELVSELNSFVIHSRHPELVSGSPGETATHYPGDPDFRQHDGSGCSAIFTTHHSPLTIHNSQLTTHNSQLTTHSLIYQIQYRFIILFHGLR